jgi:hypothetical protein
LTAIISLLGAFCVGLIVSAPLIGAIDPLVLPQGKEVFGPGPRIAAAVGSGVAAMVILGGALWSAWRLLRLRSTGGSSANPSGLSLGRLALANLFIAIGTLILSAGGVLNSVVNEMDGFALSLVAGITVIFIGFLLTNTDQRGDTRTLHEPRPWFASSQQEAA